MPALLIWWLAVLQHDEDNSKLGWLAKQWRKLSCLKLCTVFTLVFLAVRKLCQLTFVIRPGILLGSPPGLRHNEPSVLCRVSPRWSMLGSL